MHRNASAARRLVRELRGRDDVEASTPVLAALVLELGGALDDALADPDVRTSYRTAALAGQYRESLVALLGRAAGRHLHALAHNRDPRPVQARPRARDIPPPK